MKLEEALQFANELKIIRPQNACFVGEYTITYVADVAIALADEVRRLRVPAVEAVPLGYALANKLQNLLSENARLSILNYLYEQISAGRKEFSAMDMDYWDSSHDKLLEAIQNKLDDDTRKLVLELCNVVDNYTDIPLTKQIREKLGAGE